MQSSSFAFGDQTAVSFGDETIQNGGNEPTLGVSGVPGAQPHIFAFRDCFYNVKTKAGEKTLLTAINGTVYSGQVLAIMGPSGAGKTTLLNLLTMTKVGGVPTGHVTLNGHQLTPDMFSRYCSMVTQVDYHWAFLTCREVLEFAADLYLSNASEKRAKVDELIKEMGLGSCENTRCGNQFIQGLSGGQKRRLSLAVALMKQPLILFLDEPTSGLDAAAASSIMRFLKTLAARKNIIIVCTIHQPSTRVFQGFDGTMVLSNGRVAYAGKASNVVPHMSAIGKPVDDNTNPAEHLLDLVNREFTDPAEVDDLLAQWEGMAPSQPPVATMPLPPRSKYGTSMLNQFLVLLKRQGMLTFRDPSLYVGRVIMFLFSCCFFSVIYWDARDHVQDQVFYRMWLIVWYLGVPSSLGLIAVFALNIEYFSVKREIRDGMYAPAAYMVSHTLLQFPAMIVLALAAVGASAYGMSTFHADNFLPFILAYALCLWVFEAQAQFLSVAFDNPLLGALGYLFLWFSAFLFGGLMVPADDVIWPLRAFTYISAIRWSTSSLSYIEFKDTTWEGAVSTAAGFSCPGGGRCYGQTGIQVLESLHQNYKVVDSVDHLWRDSGVMLAIGVVFKLAYFVVLHVKTTSLQKADPNGPRSSTTHNSHAQVVVKGV